MKSVVACSCLTALLPLVLSAGNYRDRPIVAHWTGAVDNYWTNDANWEVEGTLENIAPGVILDQEGRRGNTGHKGDQAIFDRVSANTRIHLRGVTCISNVTVTGATTPQYRFGSETDIYQILPMGQGSTFKVDASVVNTPVIDASISIGTYPASADGNFTLHNDSAGCLDVKQWFGFIYPDPDGAYAGSSSENTTFTIAGSGDIRLNGKENTANRRVRLLVRQSGTGKLICNASPTLNRCTVSRSDGLQQVIEITSGNVLRFNTGADTQFMTSGSQDIKVTGEGTLCLSGSSNVNGYLRILGTLWLDCCVSSYVAWGAMDRGAAFGKAYAGTVKLTNPRNTIPGVIDIVDDGGTLKVTGMGQKGTVSTLGYGDGIRIGKNSRFEYAGAGETTDRTIYLWNGSSYFRHSGTGELYLDSDVLAFIDKADSVSRKLILEGEGGGSGVFLRPIADTSESYPISVEVRSGIWGLTGEQSFTGGFAVKNSATAELHGDGRVASPVVLESTSASLKVVGVGDEKCTRTISVVNKSGNNTISVSGNVSLVLEDLQRTSGTVDIEIDDPRASVCLKGKTSADASPDWLTINGYTSGFDDNGNITYSGKISGDSSVIVTGTERYKLGYPENDYTGTTEVHGLAGAYLYALFPGSIPDYAKTYAFAGRITVPLMTPEGAAAWSDRDILSLANSATLMTNAVVAVDTSRSGDHTMELGDADITSASFGIGSDGDNKLTVTGDFTKRVNFASYSGTLEFKDGKMAFGEGTVSSDYNREASGTVVFDGVEGSLSGDNQPIVIGGARYSTGNDNGTLYRGEVVIRNSKLSGACGTNTDADSRNFMIGGDNQRGTGVLRIEGDSTVVTSAFCVAARWQNRAAVYQKGGTVVNWCSGSDTSAASMPHIGYGGSGYWELSGGKYIQLGSARWGANADSVDGIFVQNGGVAEFGSHHDGKIWWFAGGRNNVTDRNLSGRALYCIFGGTGTVKDAYLTTCGVHPYGVADFLISGASSSLEFTKECILEFNRTTGSRTLFAINDGGTLITAKPLQLYTTASSPGRELVFCMDGGVIRVTVDNLNLFGPAAGDSRTANRITSYRRGAVFDTNGKTAYVYAPIIKPVGKGIKSVQLASGIEESMLFVGSPGLNVFQGDGQDAMLVALFDSEKGCVTNIHVACPGYGYESTAQISLRYANERRNSNESTNPFETIEMGDVVGGGLTKIGEGTLVLGTENTYAGATVVSNGTLRLEAAGALPASTALELAGGTMDMNGYAATLSSIRLAGGTLTGTADGFVYPAEYVYDTLDPRRTVFEDKVVFPAGARITILNADKADAESFYGVFRFAGGAEGELPEICGMENRMEHWHLTSSGTLRVMRGLSISVR